MPEIYQCIAHQQQPECGLHNFYNQYHIFVQHCQCEHVTANDVYCGAMAFGAEKIYETTTGKRQLTNVIWERDN